MTGKENRLLGLAINYDNVKDINLETFFTMWDKIKPEALYSVKNTAFDFAKFIEKHSMGCTYGGNGFIVDDLEKLWNDFMQSKFKQL